jgi:hypothetical protein
LQTQHILIRLFPATSETFAKLFSLFAVLSRQGVAIQPAKITEWNAKEDSSRSREPSAGSLPFLGAYGNP